MLASSANINRMIQYYYIFECGQEQVIRIIKIPEERDLRTGGGSWATPHQRSRAFCMARPGTGQMIGVSDVRQGSLVHNGMSGGGRGVRERRPRRQCAAGDGAVRVRRRSLLLGARPHALRLSLQHGEG